MPRNNFIYISSKVKHVQLQDWTPKDKYYNCHSSNSYHIQHQKSLDISWGNPFIGGPHPERLSYAWVLIKESQTRDGEDFLDHSVHLWLSLHQLVQESALLFNFYNCVLVPPSCPRLFLSGSSKGASFGAFLRP